ncbi:MAG: chalcone isomerase family protein [Gemmatimonadota bacterium]
MITLASLLLAARMLAAPGNPTAAPVPAPQDSGASVTRDGVTLPTQMDVDGQALVLNGTATRKKFIVKVYVAGLYLPARETDAERILDADEPRHLVMHFVHDVDKKKMCDAWNEGLEKNTPDATPELKGQFETLCSYMEDIKKGEQFVFTYLPGSGTRVSVKGVEKGTIEGKAFADALFKVWIGPHPGPGEGFKKQLLGV